MGSLFVALWHIGGAMSKFLGEPNHGTSRSLAINKAMNREVLK